MSKELKFDIRKDLFPILQPKTKIKKMDKKLLIANTVKLYGYSEIKSQSDFIVGKSYLKYISKTDSAAYDLGLENYDSLVKVAGFLIEGGTFYRKFIKIDEEDKYSWTHIKCKLKFRDDSGNLVEKFNIFKLDKYRFFVKYV